VAPKRRAMTQGQPDGIFALQKLTGHSIITGNAKVFLHVLNYLIHAKAGRSLCRGYSVNVDRNLATSVCAIKIRYGCEITQSQ
jgi:hypothetical protein